MSLHKKITKPKTLTTMNYVLFFSLILAVILTVGAFIYNTNASFNKITNGAHTSQDNFNGSHPFNVLLLGSDTGVENRHDKYGNSDTAIIATISPKNKTVYLTSIPRDTLAQIKDDDSMQKVNAAFSRGGANLSIKTISNLVNVPIKYYATVDMKGLINLVNDVGGVNVKVPFSFNYDWCSFHKGTQHLNGRHALAYARMRYDDPRGDYGRQVRQRQIIKALIEKLKDKPNLASLNKLINHVGNNAKTNLTTDSLLTIAQNYHIKTIKNDYLHGRDATINGLSYQVPSTQELNRISSKIRTYLNLPKQRVNNANTYSNSQNQDFFKNKDSLSYQVVTK